MALWLWIATPPAATTITYTPYTDYFGVDSFTYTITDVNGCTVSPTIYVTNAVSSGASPNVVAGPTYANGKFSVTFAGIPDVEYTVEYAETSPAPPWRKLNNVTAGSTGRVRGGRYGQSIAQSVLPDGVSRLLDSGREKVHFSIDKSSAIGIKVEQYRKRV